MRPIGYDLTLQEGNDSIAAMLLADKPCMISRFGGVELDAVLRNIDITAPYTTMKKLTNILRMQAGPFWWDNSIRKWLRYNAGFFPVTDEMMAKFASLYLACSKEVDMLVYWEIGEQRLRNDYFPHADIIRSRSLEPYRHSNPWSSALVGKKVVVIHPFASTIKKQYQKRKMLFKDPSVLPDFDLITYKAVQSIAGNDVPFNTWFDALETMCNDLSNINFDIALIGAGAYGLPLAAHIKKMKKKAVHIGGATQLLFGIRGKRWDNYPLFREKYYNKHWIHPLPEDCPPNHQLVEGGCYW